MQFSVGKKMAAVDFTNIPYLPYTANKVQEKQYFSIFVPVLTTSCMLVFEGFSFYERYVVEVSMR